MSLPTFPPIEPPLSREGSINEIISSIAAEELSLSHILNAEGEKLQYVLGTLPGLEAAAALDEVMQVNQSVQETLSSVMEQQMLLTGKLAPARPDLPALREPPALQVLRGLPGPLGPPAQQVLPARRARRAPQKGLSGSLAPRAPQVRTARPARRAPQVPPVRQVPLVLRVPLVPPEQPGQLALPGL